MLLRYNQTPNADFIGADFKYIARQLALRLSPAILFLLAWQCSVADSNRLKFLFGSPSAILVLALREYQSLAFWYDIYLTGAEALAGLILGSLLGTFAGTFLWLSPAIERHSRPYITCIGSIPIFSLAPLLIIWFGIGFTAKMFMAAFGVFVIALTHTIEGFRSSAQEHIAFARQLNASTFEIVSKILLPSALRWLLTAPKINVGIALLGAFIGEFISSQAGLGHYIIQAGQTYNIPGVLFGVFNLTLLALGFTGVISNLARRYHD